MAKMDEYQRIDSRAKWAFCGLMAAGISPIVADVSAGWLGVVLLIGGGGIFFYNLRAIGR